MSMDYDVVARRINEERIRLGLSPKEMARFMYSNQRNYNNVEKGLRRFSYTELKYLCDSPVDVQYVITGNKRGKTFNEHFTHYKYEQLVNIMNFISSVGMVVGTGDVLEYMNKIYFSAEVLSCKERKKTLEVNMFYIIRRIKNYSQKEMAAQLGVDVKKLRDLENNRSLPDSELVWRMYQIFGLSPAIILKDKECLINEICFVLEGLAPEIQAKILDVIEVVYSISPCK
ncbi:MAG: helix-turn-helix domain-containing protein [Lachnospiraceae bacterium]|nr:helix-turn-helix domain-containing protein [Lachnospiraceae bacterium]